MKHRPILLVEDNPDDEALILRSLKTIKVANHVHVVHDGVEAIDYLYGGSMSAPPSVVLLDLKLPRMDGFAVLKRIREHPSTRALPVVVLTSSSQDSDVLSTYELGANSFVRKPVEAEEFARATAQLGLYWTIVNHPLRE